MKYSGKVAVISGCIGSTHATAPVDSNYVHYSPIIGDCYMFCDNLELREFIESRGWIFCHIDCSDIEPNNSKQFNLRYKEIKFLGILKQEKYKHLLNYEYIVCIDHKIKMWPQHIEDMIESTLDVPFAVKPMSDPPPSSPNGDVMDEFNASMFQSRYKEDEEIYIKLINHYLDKGYNRLAIRPLTGLACYNLKYLDEILKFSDEILTILKQNNIIQCQIISFFIYQKTRMNWLSCHQLMMYDFNNFKKYCDQKTIHGNGIPVLHGL